MKRTTQGIFAVSVLLNIISLLIFIPAAFIKTSSLSFYKMDTRETAAATAAAIVSVPEGGGILFNAVEMSHPAAERLGIVGVPHT
jgi:hypothetical protein